eukprot:6181478-Pleurochrysis_carterae.AAC.4
MSFMNEICHQLKVPTIPYDKPHPARPIGDDHLARRGLGASAVATSVPEVSSGGGGEQRPMPRSRAPAPSKHACKVIIVAALVQSVTAWQYSLAPRSIMLQVHRTTDRAVVHTGPLACTHRANLCVVQANEQNSSSDDASQKSSTRKKTAAELLEEAAAKLDDNAPASWADLGNPKKVQEPASVDPLLSALPLVAGAFALVLFVLNAFGLFGEGPDLDALAEEWSKL